MGGDYARSHILDQKASDLVVRVFRLKLRKFISDLMIMISPGNRVSCAELPDPILQP